MVEKIYLNLTCVRKDYIYYSCADNRYFLVFFLPPCSFLVPLTLASRFFFSFCCFLEFFVATLFFPRTSNLSQPVFLLFLLLSGILCWPHNYTLPSQSVLWLKLFGKV